ncbi:MAG: helix-turn-helix domain-containing protein [Treponema sp.]|nr:helix-turn-helix domain-containing protein [Treponema sp.]
MDGMGERLKRIRKELGINQGEFARRLELSQSTYSAIENEKEILTPRNIKLICLEFEVNTDWLLHGGDGPIFNSGINSNVQAFINLYNKLLPETQAEVLDYAKNLLKLQKYRESKQAVKDHLGQIDKDLIEKLGPDQEELKQKLLAIFQDDVDKSEI